MRDRYREFRKFGHGRILSVLHAPTQLQFLAGICVTGVILGFIL